MKPILYLVTICTALQSLPISAQDPPPSIFRHPIVIAQYTRLQNDASTLIKKKDYDAAQKKCEESIKLAPQYPGGHYNLACVLALVGKKDEAFASLNRAIASGFADAKHIEKDADLESLREDERFKRALAAAEKAKPLTRWPDKVELAAIKNGEVFVGEKNTAWDTRMNAFAVAFDKGAAPKDKGIAEGMGEAGDLLRKWSKEGTAAGHHGDYYDNHDEDHSNMSYDRFPQLTRIEFAKEAKLKELQLHRGLQVNFFYNGVVLGNASVAMVDRTYWRSMTRLAYTNPRTANILYRQYLNNHIYFYPEHQDHDIGRNGQGEQKGHGDVLPANTPYVITSQGSSGSDRVFMDAVAATLAAFRPEVKEKLVKEGLVMPTVQMIFRRCNKNVKSDEDYLSGKAHPSVFEGTNVDSLAMVKLAHEMTIEDVPPPVVLQVKEEFQPVLGRDYFDYEARGEQLFTTPCAVARVMRSTALTRRMVVRAEPVTEFAKKPLTYHWVVLRGDPKGVTIKPLDKEKREVELMVAWQERRPVEVGSKLESNRIDIGVFVHNGKYYSAPSFITYFSLDNQKRFYDENKRLTTMDYTEKNYVDPLLDVKKPWLDQYHYDDKGRPIGWTRLRDTKKQEFTVDGATVEEKDAKGRAIKARTVRYESKAAMPREAPTLEQQPGDEVLHYEYASDEDRVGKVVKREKKAQE